MEIKGLEIEFINDFYKRIGEFKTIDSSLDYVFDTLGDLLIDDKEYNLVDEILKRMIVENFSVNVLTSVLTITFIHRKKLPSRKDFYQKVENYSLIKDGSTTFLIGLNDD